MKSLGLCLVVIICSAATNDAHAEAYSFYRPLNSSSQVIATERSQTQYEACQSALGHFYDSVTFPIIDAITYDVSTGLCSARLDSAAVVVVTPTSGSSTCAGDVSFDFSRQTCAVIESEVQLYGVVFSAFLWMCLMGGLMYGERVGA